MGVTAAYLLQRAGQKVCLIERDLIASGDTCCTTAHLTYVTDLRLSQLIRTFGKEGAKLAWQGGAAAINSIERIVAAEEIDCDFKRIPGYLHGSLTSTRDESKELQKEQEVAEGLGFECSYDLSIDEVRKPGIRFPNQAKFHPVKYLAALTKAIVEAGGQIFEHTEAAEFTENPRTVKANNKTIACDYIIVATHNPVAGETAAWRSALLHTKVAAYSSYVIGANIPKGTFPEATYWDTSSPYYYLRVDQGATTDYAIFGGQDHKTGQAKDPQANYQKLEEELLKLIPGAKVERQWSGQVIETHDGLPLMGETAERQFTATGFSGNGMTFGTLAAMMACDAVLKRTNPWQELFAPERKKLNSVWNFVTENFDYPYYLVRDLVAGAEVQSPEKLERGEGKVLKLEGQRVACSRDNAGKLHFASATCTHMGCIVHWNNAGQSWDCPCHGSRFEPSGAVIAGPAQSPLGSVQLKAVPAAH